MPVINYIRRFSLLFLSLSLFLLLPLNPCSWAVSASPSAAMEALQQRANQYWQYKLDGKFEMAYELEDPESVKDVSLTEYVRSFGSGVKWLKAEARSAKMQGDDLALVEIMIRYVWTFTPHNPKDGFEGITYEPWRLRDNQWYHVYQKPSEMFRRPDREKPAETSKGVKSQQESSKPEKENSQPGQQSSAPEESKSEEGSPQPEKQDI